MTTRVFIVLNSELARFIVLKIFSANSSLFACSEEVYFTIKSIVLSRSTSILANTQAENKQLLLTLSFL